MEVRHKGNKRLGLDCMPIYVYMRGFFFFFESVNTVLRLSFVFIFK